MISRKIADTFKDRVYSGGLTYSGHPLACASIVASIGIFKEERIIEHARMLGTDIIGPELAKIAAKHPSVGEVRGLGVFWALDLVKDRKPAAARAVQRQRCRGKPMTELVAACELGVWPFPHFNRLQVAPPCTVGVDEAREVLFDDVRRSTWRNRYCTG